MASSYYKIEQLALLRMLAVQKTGTVKRKYAIGLMDLEAMVGEFDGYRHRD